MVFARCSPSRVSPVTFCLCCAVCLGKRLLPVESAASSGIFGAAAVFSPTYARVKSSTSCLKKIIKKKKAAFGDFNMVRVGSRGCAPFRDAVLCPRQSMSSLSGPLQVVPDIDDQVANPENPQEVGLLPIHGKAFLCCCAKSVL